MRGLMQMQDADLVKIEWGSNDKDVLRAILIITAPLTSELADKLKIGYLFKENGDPVIGPDGIALGYTLVDNELHLPVGTTPGVFEHYRASSISNFKVARKDDLHLTVTFRAHIVGDSQSFELLTFRKRYLKDKFECAIRSLQNEFSFDGATENEGTRVPLSGGKSEENGPLFQQPGTPAECLYCDRDVPRNSDGLHMHEGALIECPRPVPPSEFAAAEKESACPALASRTSMGMKKEKLRERRRPTAEEIDEATVSVQ